MVPLGQHEVLILIHGPASWLCDFEYLAPFLCSLASRSIKWGKCSAIIFIFFKIPNSSLTQAFVQVVSEILFHPPASSFVSFLK